MLKLNNNEIKETVAITCLVGLYQLTKDVIENPKGKNVDGVKAMNEVEALMEMYHSVCENEES